MRSGPDKTRRAFRHPGRDPDATEPGADSVPGPPTTSTARPVVVPSSREDSLPAVRATPRSAGERLCAGAQVGDEPGVRLVLVLRPQHSRGMDGRQRKGRSASTVLASAEVFGPAFRVTRSRGTLMP